MSSLGIQQHTDMNKLLFGSESVPKKRGVKKIINIGTGAGISGNNGAITGVSCLECSLKNNIINTLNLKLDNMEMKLKEAKDKTEEEKKAAKEKKEREKPVLTDEEKEALRLAKEEKERKKQENKEKLEKLEEENAKLKAELLTRFGVNL
jgi:hypothetical protein